MKSLTYIFILFVPLFVAGGTGDYKPVDKKYPMAITMWDFSWLERRWPGAGYEDWDMALDELKERGYNCIRIDAFPHLMNAGAEDK